MRLALLLALVMLFPVPARAIAEWTVMSYFDADCDLERAMPARNFSSALAAVFRTFYFTSDVHMDWTRVGPR